MSIDPGLSDHAAVAINVLGYLHGMASSKPDRPVADALRSALAAAAETSPLPERYLEFIGSVTDRAGIFAAVPHRPVAAATGNPELDRVTSAARWWRDSLVERDTAILDAFAAGILGQDIAAAASMSVAGVYRLRQRAAGEFHR
jgi:hypothetical protein